MKLKIENATKYRQLPDECSYKLQETLRCRTIFSMD